MSNEPDTDKYYTQTKEDKDRIINGLVKQNGVDKTKIEELENALDKGSRRNNQLAFAIKNASNRLLGIGSAGYEEDGTFTSDSNWKCARQIIDELQKALEE